MTLENKLFNKLPYRYIIWGFWGLVVTGLLVAVCLFVHVAKTKMPDTQELENPRFDQSSIVYSDDLVEINRYFQRNRQWVKYDDLSPHLVDALMATEDYRFFKHSGIDAKGTGRAIAFMGSRGGASTITQQLAKQFFTEVRSRHFLKRVWQKMKEWVIAVEFERRYTKEEILAMFLNKFDFRYQGIGVGSAANIYFGKNQKDLTVSEASILIGMLKNPRIYSPIRAPEQCVVRRNVVLSQMRKYKFISDQEYELYKNEALDMSKFNRGENYDGLAPHFMAVLKEEIKQIFAEQGISKPGGAKFNLDTDGLEIYTTIDSRYQRHAEAATLEHMREQQKTFEAVWQDKDPWEYIEEDEDDTEESLQRQKRSRENQLTELVELSDIYQSMRLRYLDDIIRNITTDIPEARLWSGDINRLLRAEQNRSYLDDLINKEYIRPDQKKVYEQILKSEKWNILKSRWKDLKTAARQKLNTRKMTTVYTYDGPKEVLMSPLDSIKYMASFLQLGSISMDPHTGYVKTWVGGTDYDHWKYDHVTSSRQVGSTFKPFVYAAAINNAISPCLKVRDMQYVIPAGDPAFGLPKTWDPKNTRGKFSDEYITLKDGLKQSLNSVSVYIVKELGSVDPIVSLAEEMGVEQGKIGRYPSIVLGAPSLSVLEMTTAYSTFANDGVSVKPIFIKKIVYDGRVIYEDQSQSKRTISKNVNYAMVQLLQHASSVVGYRLKSTFGGKTGTTNDHVDGWYMGITPNLVTGTWVGGEYSWIRYLSLDQGQGGRMARPFFLDYMERLEKDESIHFDIGASFEVPEDITIVVDCEAYEPLEIDPSLDPFEDLELDTIHN